MRRENNLRSRRSPFASAAQQSELIVATTFGWVVDLNAARQRQDLTTQMPLEFTWYIGMYACGNELPYLLRRVSFGHEPLDFGGRR
jgi:hypothetical protein